MSGPGYNEKQEVVIAILEAALAQRNKGNELFVAGNMQGAFAEWHRVVFRLKGFTEQINAAFPRPAETHSSYSDPTPKHDMSLDPATAALESQNVALIGKVQNALCLTYAAMSAAHLKSEKWSKALRNALNALAIDPKNVKAKFREGQARIKLGDHEKGKQVLQELYDQMRDPTVGQILKQLDIDERARDKSRNEKHAATFRGMYSRATVAKTAPAPAADSTATDSNALTLNQSPPAQTENSIVADE